MTKTCCVPGCKSNYNSSLKAGAQLVSTFSFPKDELLRGKWLRALPRDNWSPSQYSVVCGLHFPASDIIREDNYLLPDGSVQKIPKKIRLSPSAVPSIFPHLPQFLSKKVTRTRKTPVERRKVSPTCMVLFCKTRGMVPGIKYFRLTHIRHDSWLRALGRNPDIEQLSYSNRVCSIHFSENDILRHNNQIINIKPGAVPTKLLGIKKAPVPVDNMAVTSRSDIVDNINQTIFLGDRIKTEITDTEDKYKNDSFANESSFITLKKPKEEVCDEDFLDSPMLFKEEEIMVKDEDGQNISDIVENINHVLSSGDRINSEVTETEEISKSDSFANEMSFVTFKVPKEEVCDEDFLDSPILFKQEEIMIKDEEGQNRDDSTEDIQPEQIGELECPHCNYQTIEKKELKKHLLQHKNLKPISELKCDQCDYQTSKKHSLTRHYVIHKNADEAVMYKCDRCEHQTKWKANLSQHIKKIHKKSTTYRCEQCNYQTLREGYLTQHNLIHEKPGKIYMCKRALCDFQTIHKSKLAQHFLIHKRPGEAIIYKCDQCDFKTKSESTSINHIKIHKTPVGSITYRCDQCDYQTISKCSLKSHHLLHKKTVVGMYKCNQCDYQTILKVYLAKHQQIHKITED